jgi:hypothetical protein
MRATHPLNSWAGLPTTHSAYPLGFTLKTADAAGPRYPLPTRPTHSHKKGSTHSLTHSIKIIKESHERDAMTPIAETAAEFLRERGNWLRVETVDRPGGGWDLVLRLDGNYSSSVNGWKAELGRHFQERLLEVFRTEGIPPRLLHDWAVPVERELRGSTRQSDHATRP